jgi:hypothetical protein
MSNYRGCAAARVQARIIGIATGAVFSRHILRQYVL